MPVRKLNFVTSELHEALLRNASERAQLTMSDFYRRMIEFCSQDQGFNQVVPAMSGRLQLTESEARS